MLISEFSPVETCDIHNYKIIDLCCFNKFMVISDGSTKKLAYSARSSS